MIYILLQSPQDEFLFLVTFKNHKKIGESTRDDRALSLMGGRDMGMYKYLTKLWQDAKEKIKPIQKERLIKWRKQPSIVKLDKPTRIDKARRLGYKAKQGFVVARIRIKKGGRKKRSIPKGRRPKRYGRTKFSTVRSLQAIAEQRINRKFPNLEVLNSYYAGDDSQYVWYEVIMVDKNHPAIKKDKDINWITTQRGRAYRGLTSAGKKSRGSRRK